MGGGPVLNLRARDVATTLADVGGDVFFGGVWVSLDARALRLFPPLFFYIIKKKKTTTNAHVPFFIAILAEKGDGIFYAV